MRRRDFITFLGAAAAWSRVARSQQASAPVIGFLHPQDARTAAPVVAEFLAGLAAAASLTAATSTSFIAGPKHATIDCRRWRRIW